jgi:hypothetical protein
MIAVIIGAVFGWSATRVLVGQSALTTAVVSPLSGGTVQLESYTDAVSSIGPSALGFTVQVPSTWEQYRVAPPGDGAVSVRFVSPDGSRELRVDKIVGTKTKPAAPADFTKTLTKEALGVASSTIQLDTGTQVRYRTERVGGQGTSSRVGYVQLTKAGDDIWAVQLIVPADQADDNAQQLFNAMVTGFRP